MPLRVDIISDVVCPWCAVGYRQLKQASAETGHEIGVYWHPFELNPDMVPEGENLKDHIKDKYGSSDEQSAQTRAHLKALGDDLGFAFNFQDDSRIYNTLKAHQLIHWAGEDGKSHDLKQALLKAYFTDGKDVSDVDVLVATAASVGLDAGKARTVLDTDEFAELVRSKEAFWQNKGVRGVPAMVFAEKYLVTGAQGTENYANILTQLSENKQ
ncbi:DsbA family oxidoreductase [Cognatishimia maritima]|uniref:Predicted dithiol-disulfide isomerase, DsbA family n=1 Tax=Cognatishimia maritima TaxID=870908 RepID=A0A1M5JZW9_9RHOB|nr:DsbA family oxidoreductase [Cognatishimia maritima]SHG46122.1 Predicted dithiol-disulfide isomerase, DsbA family [Cognatishimia maritima]